MEGTAARDVVNSEQPKLQTVNSFQFADWLRYRGKSLPTGFTLCDVECQLKSVNGRPVLGQKGRRRDVDRGGWP